MDCAQTMTLIECYTDGELDAITSSKVEQHLQHCATCQRARDTLGSLHTLVKDGAPYYTAPDRLRRQIRPRTMAGPRDGTASVEPAWWHWWRPAALVAVTAAVTWIVAALLGQPSERQHLAGEIISGYARSTLTGHVTDVASSERHTVKPWLSAKLDFSPPVTDLGGAGFPLLGGLSISVSSKPTMSRSISWSFSQDSSSANSCSSQPACRASWLSARI
jgi:anti-sigma factor RsiW